MTYTVIFALPGESATQAVSLLVGHPTPAEALLELLRQLHPDTPLRVEACPGAPEPEVLLADGDDDLVPLPGLLPSLWSAVSVLRYPSRSGMRA